MRRAFFGFLMAAAAALPVAAQAQDPDRTEGRSARAAARAEHYRQMGERNQARAERRQEVRSERVERREVRQEARQAVRQERVEQAAPVQQQQSWSGRRGDGQRGQRWGGRDDSARQAYRQRVEETRAANQQSIDESIGGNYARQGRRNQADAERQLRREYGLGDRDGRRGGWDRARDGRDGRWSDNRWSGHRDGRRGGWDRGWRNNSRYDWQRWRYSNRNLFRSNPYYSPYRGYRYNRLSIGLILDSLFYSNRYWLSDPWQYRLPAAPYGTQWVRYYNDVVLVDVYTGEVIDVIHDFFW